MNSRFFPFLALVFLLVAISCKPEKEDKKIHTEVEQLTDGNLVELNKQVEATPNEAMPYYKRANYYLEKKNYSEAQHDISKAIRLDSTKSAFYLTLADVYFFTNQPQKCLSALEKSIEINPEYIDGLMKLSEFKLYLHRNKESIEVANQALKVDPNYGNAYFIKGVNYLDVKDTASAIRNFQLAVEKDQGHFKAYLNLGILYSLKKNKVCLDYFNNALRINPNSTDVYYNAGLYYQAVDSLNKAIETYTKLIQIDPNYAYAHYNLGYIHYQYLNVPEQALKHFDDAVKVAPNYYQAIYMRGLCYEAMGQEKKAKAEYTRALELKPDYELALQGTKRLLNLK